MGPRDVAEIPIDSVPAWVSEGVVGMVPDPVDQVGTSIEVLAVARDPRDVPLDRFLYALTDEGEVVVHPEAEAIRSSLEASGHSAVAVYVRVRASAEICPDCYQPDPFYVDPLEGVEKYPDTGHLAWDNIGVGYGEDGLEVLPCLSPMAIGPGARSFSAPDSGVRIQPDEYLPPSRQYMVKDNTGTGSLPGALTAGEVREGWVMCLAPAVPADEVRVVEAWRPWEDRSTYSALAPLWAPLRAMAIGEWYLLKDRQVMGWNETPQPGDEPRRTNEQVVYEGDVWVSVGQALRHWRDPGMYVDDAPEPFEEELRLQMHFEGMEELLQEWDQLGLKDGLDLVVAGDVSLMRYELSSQNVEVRAEGTGLNVGGSHPVYGDEGILEGVFKQRQDLLWVFPEELRESKGSGPSSAWRVEFQDLDERDLTTEAVCAVTECRRVQVEVVFDEEPEERLLPVIPAGTRALGRTVETARFVNAPVLRASGLVTHLLKGLNWKFLVIDGRSEWMSNPDVVRLRDDGSVEYSAGVGQGSSEYDFGMSGGRPVFGGNWASLVRSAGGSAVLLVGVPADSQLGEIFLMRDGGPVWRVQ